MDTLTRRQRSERMSRVRSVDTKPEMLVRRLVHEMGYRYRLHEKKLPGRPDLVFPGRQKIVFVHGCFWHRHPSQRCALARLPKSRLDFWRAKLESNRSRDNQTEAKLRRLGWKVMVIWECQAKSSPRLVNRIKRFLEK